MRSLSISARSYARQQTGRPLAGALDFSVGCSVQVPFGRLFAIFVPPRLPGIRAAVTDESDGGESLVSANAGDLGRRRRKHAQVGAGRVFGVADSEQRTRHPVARGDGHSVECVGAPVVVAREPSVWVACHAATVSSSPTSSTTTGAASKSRASTYPVNG